ncbi:unnamed protein product [Symbiodinium pilosum]|uniref:Uncharacterized protein n=1 Tax=Symbiodinium pilosum TaxID=2952 RepID=A0A812KJK7_SYMPI|nr:unnamed protein product [Symbiodinium pilosum]
MELRERHKVTGDPREVEASSICKEPADDNSDELLRLKQQVHALEQNLLDRALDHEQKLAEQRSMLEAQLASQQNHFSNECEKLWRAISHANMVGRAAPSAHSAAASGVSRPHDPSAASVLRQIYTAVSELP